VLPCHCPYVRGLLVQKSFPEKSIYNNKKTKAKRPRKQVLECQRRGAILAVGSRTPKALSQKGIRKRHPLFLRSFLCLAASADRRRNRVRPPPFFRSAPSSASASYSSPGPMVTPLNPSSPVLLLVYWISWSGLMAALVVSLTDAVGSVQLPLVRDGGAVADLHLHIPQDALPLPPHPTDRVRLLPSLLLFLGFFSCSFVFVPD
jgi:hypothetical protein